jgi:hypothetical protein
MYFHEAEWTPFQTHCYSENVVATGIEARASGFAARKSDHQTTEEIPATCTHAIHSLSHVTDEKEMADLVRSGARGL